MTVGETNGVRREDVLAFALEHVAIMLDVKWQIKLFLAIVTLATKVTLYKIAF